MTTDVIEVHETAAPVHQLQFLMRRIIRLRTQARQITATRLKRIVNGLDGCLYNFPAFSIGERHPPST